MQSGYGNDFGDGGPGGAMRCEECGGNYITGLCCGSPGFDSGKFHNHCCECSDFGQCIGDYRSQHCHRCGDHFFAGLSGFRCPCRGGDTEPRDPFGGGYRSSEEDFSGDFSSEEDEAAADATLPPPAITAWDGYLPGIQRPVVPKADTPSTSSRVLKRKRPRTD